MALIQFSAIVSGARNSVGGQTFSQNKGGAYVKSKPLPSQPRTSAQLQVRANFSLNAKRWSGVLDDSDRTAWAYFAANNPYTNIFGSAKVLSGMAMMMKLNQVLSQISVAPLTTPPSDLSVPALAAVLSLSGAVASGSVASLSMTTSAQVVVAGARYYLFATPTLAGGKKAGTSDYRYIGNIAAVAAATTLDLIDLWQAVYGTSGATGSHISVLVSSVNHTSGALTVGAKFDTGPL